MIRVIVGPVELPYGLSAGDPVPMQLKVKGNLTSLIVNSRLGIESTVIIETVIIHYLFYQTMVSKMYLNKILLCTKSETLSNERACNLTTWKTVEVYESYVYDFIECSIFKSKHPAHSSNAMQHNYKIKDDLYDIVQRFG